MTQKQAALIEKLDAHPGGPITLTQGECPTGPDFARRSRRALNKNFAVLDLPGEDQ